MTTTALDMAHAAMQEAGEADAQARLTWFDRLAASEMYLLLEVEATGDTVRPRIFEVEDGGFVCAFDREERLAAFAGEAAPYVALSGRAMAGMLNGQGLGLAVNLGVASEMLLDPDALTWLARMLDDRPTEIEETPREIAAPKGLPGELVAALDARLASAAGLAEAALLVSVVYGGGRRGHLLAILDAVPGAEPSLAQLVGDALKFSGLEAGALDVGFFGGGDPVTERLRRVGLRFDLPAARPEDMQTAGASPGMDPERPPRLR